MRTRALCSLSSLLPMLSLLAAAPAEAQVVPGGNKVKCRWGKPQKMDAIPGCGVPRRIHVTLPPGVDRMMFAKDDNPTLTRYMYRGKAIGAPVKVFKRMVNVARTDPVLCPSDFQKARILAFRVVKDRQIRGRPTCELGPPSGKPDAMKAMDAASAPDMRPGPMGAGAGAGAAAMGAMGPRTVSSAIERTRPVSQGDLIKMRRAMKMDSLARLLGFLGLLFGVAAAAGLLVLALTLRRRVRRLERDLDRSRADDA
jgi:hypothetical protein